MKIEHDDTEQQNQRALLIVGRYGPGPAKSRREAKKREEERKRKKAELAKEAKPRTLRYSLPPARVLSSSVLLPSSYAVPRRRLYCTMQ